VGAAARAAVGTITARVVKRKDFMGQA